MKHIEEHKNDLKLELRNADILIHTDSVGIEHIRYATGHHRRRQRFDNFIKETFKLPPTTAGIKSAHLIAFHMILPKKITAALTAAPFECGNDVFIDYTNGKDAPLERRQLCPLTVNAMGNRKIEPSEDWQAFLTWVRGINGYQLSSTESLVEELTLDMMAWGVRNIPYTLWSHAVGLRPLQPVPKSTMARIATGKALNHPLDEVAIDREARIADLIGTVASFNLNGARATKHGDTKLIEDAKAKLTTNRREMPEETINRWVSDLLDFQPRLQSAGFACNVTFGWMTDLAESGTAKKWDMRQYTRRRYIVCSASQIHAQLEELGSHPSTWSTEQADTMCATLIADSTIKDKVGLGAAISSLFAFLHSTFGCPLPTRGIHKFVPEPRPRAQFITETEIQRAIGWTYVKEDNDPQLLAIVRNALAMGWAAPFRIEELLNLQIRNIAECEDGSFEIEILPKSWHAPLKTPAAMRRVRVPKGWAADLLRTFVAMRLDQGATGKSLLFAAEDEPDQVYRKYAVHRLLLRLLKAATGDPDMTFHALRHTWASTNVAMVLASSSIANFNRLAHIAAEMGHVSAVTTLQFYSHFSESSLNCHLMSAIREIIQIGDGDAEIHVVGKSNTVLQHWRRKFNWDTEDCIWHAIEVSANKFEFANAAIDFQMVDPLCPNFVTHFVHPFHPLKVLQVLAKLQSSPHRVKEIANASHLSEEDINLVMTSVLDVSHAWLSHDKEGRQEIATISSVDGALCALNISLKSALRSKYKGIRIALSIPLMLPPGFSEGWIKSREVIKLPDPVVYFFLYPTTNSSPLLSFLRDVGVDCSELVVRVPTKGEVTLATNLYKSEIAFAFQGIWGEIPTFKNLSYHPARSKPYLTFPGKDVPGGKESSVHAEIGGLDALLFSCAVYARAMEVKNGIT